MTVNELIAALHQANPSGDWPVVVCDETGDSERDEVRVVRMLKRPAQWWYDYPFTPEEDRAAIRVVLI